MRSDLFTNNGLPNSTENSFCPIPGSNVSCTTIKEQLKKPQDRLGSEAACITYTVLGGMSRAQAGNQVSLAILSNHLDLARDTQIDLRHWLVFLISVSGRSSCGMPFVICDVRCRVEISFAQRH